MTSQDASEKTRKGAVILLTALLIGLCFVRISEQAK